MSDRKAWSDVQKIVEAGATTDAGAYGTAYFAPGRSVVQVQYQNKTTDKVTFQAQGSNSTSALWFNMLTAPTSLTSGQTARNISTAAYIFDRVRIYTTDAQISATTVGLPHTWWVSAR